MSSVWFRTLPDPYAEPMPDGPGRCQTCGRANPAMRDDCGYTQCCGERQVFPARYGQDVEYALAVQRWCESTADASWTADDGEAAEAEGWAIFDSEGSDNGPWQLQKFDDPSCWEGPDPYPFDDDCEVWLHVRTKALDGWALHARALAYVACWNREEYDRIMRWGTGS